MTYGQILRIHPMEKINWGDKYEERRKHMIEDSLQGLLPHMTKDCTVCIEISEERYRDRDGTVVAGPRDEHYHTWIYIRAEIT